MCIRDSFKYHLGGQFTFTRNKIKNKSCEADWNSAADTSRKAVTKEKVIEFKHNLLTIYHVRSVNSMLAALNSFFSFMDWTDFRVKPVKIQRQMFCEEQRELNKKEYYRLVRAAQNMGKRQLSLILQTLCGLGLRISELKSVTVESVRKGKLCIYNKGKNRIVFIGIDRARRAGPGGLHGRDLRHAERTGGNLSGHQRQ